MAGQLLIIAQNGREFGSRGSTVYGECFFLGARVLYLSDRWSTPSILDYYYCWRTYYYWEHWSGGALGPDFT